MFLNQSVNCLTFIIAVIEFPKCLFADSQRHRMGAVCCRSASSGSATAMLFLYLFHSRLILKPVILFDCNIKS